MKHDAEDIERLQRLKNLTHVMDELFTIPGLRYRVGLDGIIGLIPGFGDFIGLVISSIFIFTAAQMNISKVVVIRMLVNVLIESLVGLIPLVGDLFDFVWKANKKNLALLERSLANSGSVKRRSLGFLALLGLSLAGLIGLIGWGVVALVKLATSQF